MAEPDQNSSAAINTNDAISFGRSADIFPNAPLSFLDAPNGVVYAARSQHDQADMIAVICGDDMPVRFTQAHTLRTIDNACLLRLRDSGPVTWTPNGRTMYAFIHDRPRASAPYWSSLAETRHPVNEDTLLRRFLTPLATALAEFQRIALTHGAIRNTNLFWSDTSTVDPQLGLCMSGPAGLGQPVLFEPLERGLCPPEARGPGGHTDDTYALGVTAALMILGRNPMAGMDDQAILQAKMDYGTFNAFIGRQRLPGRYIELLRGLLSDDARQRWTAGELLEWLSGRRLTPKNSEIGKRANRGFLFAGKDYWQLRPLVISMTRNREESLKAIENGSLAKWISRSLDDQNRFHAIEEAVESARAVAKGGGQAEQVVSRVCIALDPPAPIYFRNTFVMPDGIATALVAALGRGQSPQVLSEIVSTQLVSFWVNAQKESKIDLVPLAQQIERLRPHIDRAQMGCGPERALYELNPTLPCQSPMVRSSYVLTPRALLPAMEAVAASGNRPQEPMDRHIAAFLMVHDKRGEKIFTEMSPPRNVTNRALAILTLYSELQYRFGPDHLPHLSRWLLSLMEPMVNRFFNRPMREKIRRELRVVADKGQLSRLDNLIDDPKMISKDEQEFLMARLIHKNVMKEMAELRGKLERSEESFLGGVGRPVAASLASFLAIVLVLLVSLRALFHVLM